MLVGVPKEIKSHEYRVGLTPAAVREYVARGQHRDRVTEAATLIMDRHADALRRLGE